jgi:hypothetical protein
LAFPKQSNLSRSFQPKITCAYCQGLTDARSSVVEKQQEGVIAFPMPGPSINGGNDRPGFFRLQIDCHPTDCFLVADGENVTVLTCPRYILPKQMLHEAADGGQSTVPGNSGVPASRFDMIQKREHGIRLDIVQGKVGHGLVLLICQEQEEKLQRVAVGAHGMCAGPSRVL